ncbi:MAG: hypothetical protein ACWA5K_08740 [bacterium]
MELKSQLFPSLFRHVDDETPVVVLELGRPAPETLDFLSQFRCRLYVVDIPGHEPPPTYDEETTDEELTRRFSDWLDIPAEFSFDVVFFWDLFSQFDRRSLAALSRALLPYTHKKTLVHGFGILNRNTPPEYFHYRVSSMDRLLSYAPNTRPSQLYGYSQQDLENVLDGMKILKGTLHQQGRLEVVLKIASP